MSLVRTMLLMAGGAVIAALAVSLLPAAWQEPTNQSPEQIVQVEGVTGGAARWVAPINPTPTNAQPATTTYLPRPNSFTTPTPDSPVTLTPVLLEELKAYLLYLINEDRQSHGLSPVTLGANPAAQQHAEQMLQYRYLSHWAMDGLKPYMRYTLAGGTNYEAENASGPGVLKEGVKYREKSPQQLLKESEEGLMDSPGHRRNILNRWHQRVNLGVSCNTYTCVVVQQFEGDYVQFSGPPSLSSGVLVMAGELSGGFAARSISVWYDQPPHPLTLGQLDATHSYGLGQRPAVFIRRPPPPGSEYVDSSTEFSWESGVDPYSVDPDAPRKQPVCTDSVCSSPSPLKITQTNREIVPWVTASVWEVSGNSFRIKADILSVLKALGPGVYTVVLWGEADGQFAPLTNYSIFVN